MSETVNTILLNMDYIILMLFRVAGLVVPSPVFGRTNVPARIKVGFSAALAFLFFIIYPPGGQIIEYTTLLGFALICITELLLGIALAFITNLFFTLIYVSGQLIDMQIGFGIVSVFDQQNNTQIPIVGNLLNLILLIVFFAVNGHHRLIYILGITVEKMPIGGLGFTPNIGLLMLEIFALTFVLAIMVALPIIASGFILEFAFGVLVRTVPQMNVFVVGIPIKTFVGFVMLFMIMPIFINFSERIFTEMFIAIEQVFSTFMLES